MDESKVNILLVDDDAGNLLALEAALASLDQNLMLARSGKEALKLLLKHEVAVILLDVRMPVMDGFETAALIRQREKTRLTPIIFLTGAGTGASDSETHVSRGYSLGAVDYLFKPVMPDIVSAKVAVFVGLFIAEKEREEEHARQRQKLERQLHAFSALSDPSQTTVTARAFGLKPLREGAPEKFNDMVQNYGDLMEQAMEEQAFKVDQHASKDLHALADRLGVLRANPRDVVDLHSSAIKSRTAGKAPGTADAYLEEGRLLLLQLMGHLVSYYRTRMVGSTHAPGGSIPRNAIGRDSLPIQERK